MSKSLFIAPHDDDQILFGCFTLLREKPVTLIVTDSYIQQNRGENITAEMRAKETDDAMKILKLPYIRGNCRDDIIDDWGVRHLLAKFANFDAIYAPAVQGGNKDHDLIGKVALELFGQAVRQYATYAQGEWATPGIHEIKPTPGELTLKDHALSFYVSQMNLPATRGHFEAVKGGSEWLI